MEANIKNQYGSLIALLGVTVLTFAIMYKLRKVEAFQPHVDELVEVPHYIERRFNDTPTVIANVPTVIYNSWHSNMVPPKMKENIDTLLEMNPDFDYYLFSDETSATYINYNFPREVLDAFNTLKPGAYKSDLWRYCILYKDGGVYLDIKYKTIEPLRNIINRTPELYVKDYDNASSDGTKCFYNGVMISPPKNMIFKHCINEIVNNCKLKLYRANSLDVTGPCLFGRAMKIYKNAEWANPKFLYGRDLTPDMLVDYITYDNRRIIQSYDEYRAEQRTFQKTEPYGKMWYDRNIYDMTPRSKS